MYPRITLITPSYQQAAFLEECLRSVHEQAYPDLEHIVVDGGSTDGSKEIIARYSDKLHWWCSEKDRGQSHAINKGLQHATGRIFGWLNSDDALLPGALLKVGEAFVEDPSMTVLTGARLVRDVNGGDTRLPTDEPTNTEAFFTAPRINQQSTFYRMDMVRAAQGVDEELRFVMDYELWLQVLLANGVVGVRIVPWDLAVFRHHSSSKTSTQHPRFLDEIASVLHGACAATGQRELMAVLALGHRISKGLRPLPVQPDDAKLVRKMTIAFLLKWHNTIYRRTDLRMMKRFLRTIDPATEGLDAKQREQVDSLTAQVNVPGWWAFRLRRKWNHLVR